MSTATIYHNPRCSKSRATLELLQTSGVQPQIIEYLKTPPDAATLQRLLQQLGMSAHQLVRKGEAVFKEKYAAAELSEAQWITAMVNDPVLIERPIVVIGERAVLGRPPENVLALL